MGEFVPDYAALDSDDDPIVADFKEPRSVTDLARRGQDREALLTERDTLRAEVDRLRADLRALAEAARLFLIPYYDAENDEHRALADVLARVELH